MNSQLSPQDEEKKFWSIERSIAFIVGPIVTAASGWLAIVISTKLPGHPHVSGEAIFAFASAVSLGVAGLFYKWLHGRQIMGKVAVPIEGALGSISQIPGGSALVQTGLTEIEQIAQTAANAAVAAIHGATPGQPPGDSAIPPATSDPAPATPVDDGQVADAGAAPTS